MTRALLSIFLSGLCLWLGLFTVRTQAENHARAARLDETKRRCDLLEAGNERVEAQIGVLLRDIERRVPNEIAEETTEASGT